jgi:hypothetical protein
MAKKPGIAGLSVCTELQPLFQTVTVARLVVATDRGSAFVYRAQHGVAVQGYAPAIIETRHHPATPAILLRQFNRDVVLTHQHHFQPAAASLARGARDGVANFVWCIHYQHCRTPGFVCLVIPANAKIQGQAVHLTQAQGNTLTTDWLAHSKRNMYGCNYSALTFAPSSI